MERLKKDIERERETGKGLYRRDRDLMEVMAVVVVIG